MTERAKATIQVVRGAARARDLEDWGAIPEPLRGAPRTRGRFLFRDASGAPEAGIWECTPGSWRCDITADELCHVLSGRCVYTHVSGERTELGAGDSAFFVAGWSGTCEVIETVRTVYMVR